MYDCPPEANSLKFLQLIGFSYFLMGVVKALNEKLEFFDITMKKESNVIEIIPKQLNALVVMP